MKTLYLMRHGKSAWDNPELPDHERPLSARGVRSADRVGRHLRKRRVRPDLVLCSTARRVIDTLDIVLDYLGDDIPVERERGLYLCGAQVLLQRLRDLPDTADAALLVGHNPDLQDLALLFTDEGHPDTNTAMFKAMAAKFPTGAVLILEFATGHWRDIAAGGARLVDFIQPRKLD